MCLRILGAGSLFFRVGSAAFGRPRRRWSEVESRRHADVSIRARRSKSDANGASKGSASSKAKGGDNEREKGVTSSTFLGFLHFYFLRSSP